MPKLFLTATILAIIFSACVIPTYVGKSTLNETEVIKTDVKIAKVLLVGVGSTASRVFLESLSPELIKLFGQHQVVCDFTYAGKIPRGSHVNLKRIVTAQYDSYLVLNPIDTSFMDTHKSVGVFASPLPGNYAASGSVIGNQYKEDYYVELYTNHNSLDKVWQGELKVDFDIAKSGRYDGIAEKIFGKLLENGFIPKR